MKRFITVFVLIILVLTPGIKSNAKGLDSYGFYYSDTNEETGYSAYVIDKANYLTDYEETALLREMMKCTEYANVIYYTNEENYNFSEGASKRAARDALEDFLGYYAPGVCYVCDNEYDYIYAQNEAYDVITSSKAYSITDNVYKMSADERYYDAAIEAFDEIYRVYKGQDIPQPVLYICSSFIAIFIAFLINYLIVSRRSKIKQATSLEMVMGSLRKVQTDHYTATLVSSSKTYSPVSSSSGGGHGGGGHHGGGGGHHGGGGGHSH